MNLSPRWLALPGLLLLVGADGVAEFRFFIPSDIDIQEQAPAEAAAFTKAADGPGGDFGVKIEIELSRGGAPFTRVPLSTPICNGDFLAFRFTPSEPGFVHVVNHGSSGGWSRIYPSQDWEPNAFGPEQPVRLPTHDGSGFPVSGPPGGEHVMIFFSPGPFSADLQQLEDRVLGREEGAIAVADAVTGGGTRAIQVTYLRALGTAQVAHVVGQGEQTVAFTLDHRATCDGQG